MGVGPGLPPPARAFPVASAFPGASAFSSSASAFSTASPFIAANLFSSAVSAPSGMPTTAFGGGGLGGGSSPFAPAPSFAAGRGGGTMEAGGDGAGGGAVQSAFSHLAPWNSTFGQPVKQEGAMATAVTAAPVVAGHAVRDQLQCPVTVQAVHGC